MHLTGSLSQRATIRALAALAGIAAVAMLATGCSGTTGGSPSGDPSGVSLDGQRIGISVCCPVPQIDVIANAIVDSAESNDSGVDTTVVNGNSDVQKARSDIQTFLAQGYNGIWSTLISGQGYDTIAKQAAESGVPWVNFSGSAVTGATLNIVIPEEQLGFALGVAAAGWMSDNGVESGSVGATIDSTGANTKRTEGFEAGVKSVLPDVEVFTVGNAASTTTAGQAIGANLLQAHPDIAVFFGWTADDAIGLLSAAKAAGTDDPAKFLVVSPEANDQVYKLIADGSILQIAASLGYPFGAIAGERLLEKAMTGEEIPHTAIMRPTIITPDNVELVQKQEANPYDYPDRIDGQLAFVDQVLAFGDVPTDQVDAVTP